MNFLLKLLRDDEAATAVEYAVMLALILITIIAAIESVGDGTGALWDKIHNDLDDVGFV